MDRGSSSLTAVQTLFLTSEVADFAAVRHERRTRRAGRRRRPRRSRGAACRGEGGPPCDYDRAGSADRTPVHTSGGPSIDVIRQFAKPAEIYHPVSRQRLSSPNEGVAVDSPSRSTASSMSAASTSISLAKRSVPVHASRPVPPWSRQSSTAGSDRLPRSRGRRRAARHGEARR